MNTKEELRKEFDDFCEEAAMPPYENIFEWFWKHLTESYENGYQDAKDGLFVSDLQAKIQSLEQLIKAADEVISFKGFISYGNEVEYKKALESYTTLKQQMK